METINLTVSGMTCGACVKQHVKEMIAALEESGYPAQVSTGVSSKAKSRSCKSGSSCCCN